SACGNSARRRGNSFTRVTPSLRAGMTMDRASGPDTGNSLCRLEERQLCRFVSPCQPGFNRKIQNLQYTCEQCRHRQGSRQAVMTPEANIAGLARRLVSDKLLDQEAAVSACSGANLESLPLVRHLVKHRLVESRPLALAAAREFRLPLLDLSALDLGALPLSLVDARLLKKHNVVPLMRRGNRLFLGMSDPSDSLALNEIKFHTGLIIEPVIVEEDKLTDTLHALLRSDEETSSVFA